MVVLQLKKQESYCKFKKCFVFAKISANVLLCLKKKMFLHKYPDFPLSTDIGTVV